MKKILFAVAGLAALAAPATAADLPLKAPPMVVNPAYNWTGFYVGVNGGYGWGTGSQQIIDTNPGGAIDLFRTGNPSGGFAGGQIGYNWQLGSPFVLGIEADFQGADIKGSNTGIGTQAFLETHGITVNSFGTVRGRIGYAFGSTLVYATGGLAYGNINSQLSAPTAPGVFERTNGTQTGFAVGGGLEYLFNPNWSLKAEYQYMDLGSKRLLGTPGFVGFSTNPLDTAFHTVRAGVNYHFGGPVVAKY
jgi:outer membrane immunogenic protein